MADFDANGISDLLWRNPISGDVVVWYSDNSGNIVGAQAMPFQVSGDWRLSGLGDFNSDQKSDILWHNANSGEVFVWYMDGFTIMDAASLSVVGGSWQIRGVGDFNNDGKDDLVWHNPTTGSIFFWYLDGIANNDVVTIGAASSSFAVGDPWEIRGTGDFNNDGQTDLFWQNRQTGDLVAWYMDGPDPTEGVLIATLPDLNWKPLSQGRGDLSDLTVSNITGLPSALMDGQTANLSISIANQSSRAAGASTIQYYISDDTVFNPETDRQLGTISVGALGAGQSDSFTQSFVYDVATMGDSGSKYLFFIADATNEVRESNEDNNVLSQSFTVIPPTPLNVDLTLKNVVIPPIWTVGNELTISVDVLNQGSDEVGSSKLEVYLLDSPTFDPTGASPILTDTVDPIGAGLSTKMSFTFIYRESYGTGQKYLYFVTDADGQISETDESNNVTPSRSVTVGSVDQSIDLTLTGSSAPSSVIVGQFMTISTTILNQGQTPANATSVRVYLTDYTGPNDQLDINTATFVTSLSVPSLAGAASTTVSADVAYSRLFGAGQKNIFFVVDGEEQITELNESNNVLKGQEVIDAILPDTSIDLLVSGTTLSRTSIVPGESITISATVQNIGEDSTGRTTRLRVYLSDDAVLDDGDEQISGPLINELAPEASQTVTTTYQSFVGDPAGTKYLFFRADANNDLLELEETNNITSRSFTISEVQPGIDLVFSNASVSPTTLTEGDSLTVNATLLNQGDTASNTSKLAIYVSSNATFDGSDRRIAEFDTGSIPSFNTFNIQDYAFTYLGEYGLGAQYILVVADHLNTVEESDETNNVQAFSINVSPDLNQPDLVLSNVAVFGADLGGGIDFDYTVSNEGLDANTESFTVRFYLADQNYTTLTNIETNGLWLGDTTVTSTDWAGAINTSYNALVGFTTAQFDTSNPLWSAGDRYVLAVVDYDKEIRESDETNNITSRFFTLR
jgi:subtilase family serine protease